MPADLTIQVSIPALQVENLACEAFRGREAISMPYRIEVFLVTPLDLAGRSAAGKPAWLTVSAKGKSTTFAGVVLEFRVNDKPNHNDFAYALVIAPRLSLLDFSQQTEVFAADTALDVKALLNGILDGSLSQGSTTSGHGQKLDFTVSSTVAVEYQRTNITKYNETDLNFFSRTCEHYGIFYFISTDTSSDHPKDRVTVGAMNTDFADIGTVRFKGDEDAVASDESSITSFASVERPQIKKVSLRDYNEASPSTNLISASTATTGVGEIIEYGDHFPNDGEGQKLAVIRAEELAWQAAVFEGRSTIAGLRAGTIFTLNEHPINVFNAAYVVVEVTHQAGAPAPLGFSAGAKAAAYGNSFVAIRKDRPFRPRRVTPRPVMSGVFNAQVDGETDDARAQLDDTGRYRVRFKYNDGGNHATAGKASAPLRRLQPYVAPYGGLHMPLLKNTEVLVGYVNGDPDRPVIVGAAYNAKTPDPVTKSSHTTNRLITKAGTLLEMEDGASDTGTRYLRMDVPKVVGDREATGNYLRLGSSAGADENGAKSGLTYSTSTTSVSDVDGYKNTGGGLAPGGNQDDKKFWETSTLNAVDKVTVTATSHTTSGNGVLLYSAQDLDVNIVGAATMKFGAGYATETTQGDSTHAVKAGQYTLKATNGVKITGGDGGLADVSITATNMVKMKSEGDTTFFTYGTTTKYSMGESFTIFMGFEQTLKASISLTIQLSGVITITLGASTSMTLGAKADVIVGLSAKYCIGAGDMKITTKDCKVTGTDMKIVNTDFKFSGGMDGKIVNVAFESVRSKITAKDLDVEQRRLVQSMVDLSVTKATSAARFVTIEAYL